MNSEFEGMARLLRVRNSIDREVAQMIDRPPTTGHLGEWVASKIFPISLHERASHTGSDGEFTIGPLRGRTVNVKWYTLRENSLDISPSLPDYYLVMTGPYSSVATSRGQVRPLCINEVYMFDTRELTTLLAERGVKIGIATSLRMQDWAEAQIYPREGWYSLSGEQRAALDLLNCGA